VRREGDFTARVKQQALKRSRGHCEGCGLYLGNELPRAYDHKKPLWLWLEEDRHKAGDLNNCQVLGVRCCHIPKTGDEAGVRAKTDRIRRKHNGQPQQKRRKIPSRGFDSQWRRRMDGKVERRHDTTGSDPEGEQDV
jgi:hypothetical protein